MWRSTSSPESPYSLPTDSEVHSPYTMHAFYREELAELKAAGRAVGWGLKKDSRYEVARGDLLPQSPVYEYGASELEDEPYSDEEHGPAVVDQPAAIIDQAPAPVEQPPDANVVNEEVFANSEEDSDDDYFEDYNASEVTS